MRKDTDGEFWQLAAPAVTWSYKPFFYAATVIGLISSHASIKIYYNKSSSTKTKTKARPEIKKQSREKLEKKKNSSFKKRSGKQPRSQPRPHHPSKKGHRKY